MSDELDSRADFEALYRRHYHAVAGYVGRRLSADAVDDAVSDVFTVAWRRRATHASPGVGWLLAIARNVVLTQYRNRSRLPVLIDDARIERESASPHDAEWVAGRVDLLQALSRLSVADRETLLLIAWDGLSTAEAAAAVDCSPGAFRVRLSRARERLRDLLGDPIHHHTPEGCDRSSQDTAR